MVGGKRVLSVLLTKSTFLSCSVMLVTFYAEKDFKNYLILFRIVILRSLFLFRSTSSRSRNYFLFLLQNTNFYFIYHHLDMEKENPK